MEYLHLKRIVHFDLKTGNLLVGFRGKSPTCKVADFGLSKQRQQTYVTGVTSLRGTLPWTAPEVIRTPKVSTERGSGALESHIRTKFADIHTLSDIMVSGIRKWYSAATISFFF